MQKINLRDLYPDVYKTDVFVDVAEEVLTAIRNQQQGDAAYSGGNPGAEAAEGGSVCRANAAARYPSPAYLRTVLPGNEGG